MDAEKSSIECLAVSGRNELWEIVIDGNVERRIHRTIFGRAPKFPSFAAREEWPALFEKKEYQAARRYLIWRLTKQTFHSEQLIKILSERLVGKETIQRLIEEFKAAGYLDDQAWIERYLHSRTKKEGLPKILAKLRRMGFSGETLQEIGNSYKPEAEEEQEAIQKLLVTKYKNKKLSDLEEKRKVIASLIRRGFSYDSIKEAIALRGSSQTVSLSLGE